MTVRPLPSANPFVIVRGVPLPKRRQPRSPLRQAIEDLKVGDEAVKIPVEQEGRARSICGSVGRETGRKFKVRPWPKQEADFCGAWRVK